MPGGIVEEDGCVLLPAWSFVIQLLSELPDEEAHHVGIRVGLCQRTPDPSIRVERCNHRDQRLHLFVGDRARSTRRHPHLPQEPGAVEPALVNVNNSTT